MGLFIHDDPGYDPEVRQVGFNRYKQLMAVRFSQWWRINLMTLIGFLPLAIGIFFAVQSTSILVLIPVSIVGGMVAGPFVAGMFDAILRGLRDESKRWWYCYKLSWKQNWRGSLLPGALLGLMLGLYAFMGMLFWWSETGPSLGTVALYLFSLLLLIVLNSLYWPQLVLFNQSVGLRLRNCLLFVLKYFWKAMGAGLMQLAYWAVLVLLAPWTVLLLPVTGIWYILFLSQFFLYRSMDEAFRIEEQFEQFEEEVLEEALPEREAQESHTL